MPLPAALAVPALFLGERLTPARAGGVLLVLCGAVMLGGSART